MLLLGPRPAPGRHRYVVNVIPAEAGIQVAPERRRSYLGPGPRRGDPFKVCQSSVDTRQKVHILAFSVHILLF
jgi:hypothetical protein